MSERTDPPSQPTTPSIRAQLLITHSFIRMNGVNKHRVILLKDAFRTHQQDQLVATVSVMFEIVLFADTFHNGRRW